LTCLFLPLVADFSATHLFVNTISQKGCGIKY
jgi:hypothetical protein